MLLAPFCDLHACSYFAALEQHFSKYFNSAVSQPMRELYVICSKHLFSRPKYFCGIMIDAFDCEEVWYVRIHLSFFRSLS